MKTIVSMIRGDTKEIVVEAKTRTGTEMDLAQAETITFTVKLSRTDSDDDALIQKTMGDGITVTDEFHGHLMVTIAPEDTSGFTTSKTGLQWDLQMVTFGGAVFTLADGLLNVKEDVTRES